MQRHGVDAAPHRASGERARDPGTRADAAHGGLVVASLAAVERVRDEIVEAISSARAPALPVLLDREQAAAWLGCSVRTIDTLRGRGMPTIMIGDSPRFEPSSVVDWMRGRP